MKSLGIRQAKARLSELVRAAARGECSLVTDNGKPVAMIAPLPEGEAQSDQPAGRRERATPFSDAIEFRHALLSAPYALELDF